MSCRYSDTERNDYVDELLEPAERQAFDAHLSACDACSVAVRELSAIVRQAKELAPMTPEQDLRDTIRARIEAGQVDVAANSEPDSMTEQSSAAEARSLTTQRNDDVELSRAAPVVSSAAVPPVTPETHSGSATQVGPATYGRGFKPWWMGAAAAALVVLLVGAWAAGRWSGSATAVSVSPAELASELEGNWSKVRADYDAMSAELEREFSHTRSELPDDVLAEVDRTLRMLDDAIADLQLSTEGQDSDQESMKQLTALYRKKMELLWKTSVIASASQRT